MLIFTRSLRVCLAVEPPDLPVKEETIIPLAVQHSIHPVPFLFPPVLSPSPRFDFILPRALELTCL